MYHVCHRQQRSSERCPSLHSSPHLSRRRSPHRGGRPSRRRDPDGTAATERRRHRGPTTCRLSTTTRRLFMRIGDRDGQEGRPLPVHRDGIDAGTHVVTVTSPNATLAQCGRHIHHLQYRYTATGSPTRTTTVHHRQPRLEYGSAKGDACGTPMATALDVNEADITCRSTARTSARGDTVCFSDPPWGRIHHRGRQRCSRPLALRSWQHGHRVGKDSQLRRTRGTTRLARRGAIAAAHEDRNSDGHGDW